VYFAKIALLKQQRERENKMTKYEHRVNVKKFNYVSPDLADMIVKTMGNMAQKGAKYHEALNKHANKHSVAVFQSNSARDLIDAMEHGFWDHSSRLNDVEKGSIVYIVTNKSTRTSLGNNLVLEGVATGQMIKRETDFHIKFFNSDNAISSGQAKNTCIVEQTN